MNYVPVPHPPSAPLAEMVAAVTAPARHRRGWHLTIRLITAAVLIITATALAAAGWLLCLPAAAAAVAVIMLWPRPAGGHR